MPQILGNPEGCRAPAEIYVTKIVAEVAKGADMPREEIRRSFGCVYMDIPHCVSAQIGSCPGPAPLEKTATGLSCPHTRCAAHEARQLA